jgi:antitoxin (DNA-binding transcriptional repressor) of toxin-antitoxin stability system
MIRVQVGELKTNFSSYLKRVINGEEIAVAFGKKNETMAYLIPVENHPGHKIKLGLGQEKGFGYTEGDDSSFSASELKEMFDID